ncbi:hypothetical protein E1281_28175, partial [Actinomadura sp. KC345]
MRPHPPKRLRLVSATIFAAAMAAPAFVALPAQADDCKGGDPFGCQKKWGGSGSPGGPGGGGSGGGGISG